MQFKDRQISILQKAVQSRDATIRMKNDVIAQLENELQEMKVNIVIFTNLRTLEPLTIWE